MSNTPTLKDKTDNKTDKRQTSENTQTLNATTCITGTHPTTEKKKRRSLAKPLPYLTLTLTLTLTLSPDARKDYLRIFAKRASSTWGAVSMPVARATADEDNYQPRLMNGWHKMQHEEATTSTSTFPR